MSGTQKKADPNFGSFPCIMSCPCQCVNVFLGVFFYLQVTVPEDPIDVSLHRKEKNWQPRNKIWVNSKFLLWLNK